MGWRKPGAFVQRRPYFLAVALQNFGDRLQSQVLACFHIELFIVKVRVIEAIQEKVQQIRHHCFHAFLLQVTHNIIVGAGVELDQNLSDHTHTGLAELMNGKPLEVLHDAADIGAVNAQFAAADRCLAALHPFPEKSGGRPFLQFVGPGPVQEPHQQIPVGKGHHPFVEQAQGNLEARAGGFGGEAQGNHRHVPEACIGQGLAQEADVVGGPAAASRLGDHNGGILRVVIPGFQG
ncbi:hypothetical protein D3C75_910220 [compost metagenome]